MLGVPCLITKDFALSNCRKVLINALAHFLFSKVCAEEGAKLPSATIFLKNLKKWTGILSKSVI